MDGLCSETYSGVGAAVWTFLQLRSHIDLAKQNKATTETFKG